MQIPQGFRVGFLAMELLVGSEVHGKEVASSPDFTIDQVFDGEMWKEEIRFRKASLSAAKLDGLMWPGIYSVSPDGRFVLRVQKTGSGDNVAILYRVEKNGRVTQVPGLDDQLWRYAHPAGKRDLFHTGISEVQWAKDGASLRLRLRGTFDGAPKEFTKDVVYRIEEHQLKE